MICDWGLRSFIYMLVFYSGKGQQRQTNRRDEMNARNTKEIIGHVAAAARNCEESGTELTAKNVAWFCSCSESFAVKALQYWEGAGRPTE